MRSAPRSRCALKKRGSFWPKVARHCQRSSPNTQQPPVGHGEVHGKRSKTTIAGEAEGGVLVEHLIVTWTLENYGAMGNKKGYLQSNANFVMKYFDLYRKRYLVLWTSNECCWYHIDLQKDWSCRYVINHLSVEVDTDVCLHIFRAIVEHLRGERMDWCLVFGMKYTFGDYFLLLHKT